MHDAVMPLLHAGVPVAREWTAWSWEPGIWIPLGFFGAAYAAGVRKLWTSRAGRGITHRQAAAFVAGWVVLVLALLSPLHRLSEQLFAAHMVQHELLIVLAAPLLVVARPVAPTLWGLPRTTRRALPAALRKLHVDDAVRAITTPFRAWLLHGLAIWLWHLPVLFQATLTSDMVHAAQHLSFLGTALVFWWALLRAPRRSRGTGVLYLFTTAVHTSVLGALMTFSRTLWYPAYATSAAVWGLTPLQDQQLAGLIMWIPGSVSYLVGALSIAAAWLRDSELQVAERQRVTLARPA